MASGGNPWVPEGLGSRRQPASFTWSFAGHGISFAPFEENLETVVGFLPSVPSIRRKGQFWPSLSETLYWPPAGSPHVSSFQPPQVVSPWLPASGAADTPGFAGHVVCAATELRPYSENRLDSMPASERGPCR